MILKVMVYAYMDNTYSSRKIETAITPLHLLEVKNFRTYFKDIIKQVMLLLAQEGLVTLKEVYTDRTKIESVAARYTFVWGNV